jgi:hypothetical protein
VKADIDAGGLHTHARSMNQLTSCLPLGCLLSLAMLVAPALAVDASSGWTGQATSKVASEVEPSRSSADDPASIKALLEQIHISVYVLLASECGSSRREREINQIITEWPALAEIYKERYGEEPVAEMWIIEGNGCAPYYRKNLKRTLKDLKRVRAFLHAN